VFIAALVEADASEALNPQPSARKHRFPGLSVIKTIPKNFFDELAIFADVLHLVSYVEERGDRTFTPPGSEPLDRFD
jgi:hypothetical protein